MNKKPKPRVAVAIHAAVVLAMVFFLFPVLWMILTSFKQRADAFTDIPTLIFTPTLENYKEVLIDRGFLTYIGHSMIVGLIATFITLLLAVSIAYPLARFRLRGSNQISVWILSLRYMPPIASLVPLYLLFSNLHLINKFPSLILMYTFMNLPLAVWMLRGFFADLPRGLEEAALVDGASAFGTFFRIALPLVVPGLISTALLLLIFCWNEFLFANVLTGASTRTAAVGLTEYSTPVSVFWTQIMAAGSIVVLPVLLISISIQRYVVRGLTMGAVKG